MSYAIFTMGGYAAYVWPAYALVLLILIAKLMILRWQKKRLWSQLRQWFYRQP